MEKSNTLPAKISTALLLLRIASAMAFLYHGSAILFGSFGGPGPQQLAASHHWPVVMGYLTYVISHKITINQITHSGYRCWSCIRKVRSALSRSEPRSFPNRVAQFVL